MKEEIYEYWLDKIKPLRGKKKCQLCKQAGSAKALFYMEETAIRKTGILNEKELLLLIDRRKNTNPEKEYEELRTKKIQFVSCMSKEYPQRLLQTESPPFGIYIKGVLLNENIPSVAVIGARQCSTYGQYLARETGKALALAGVQVVSGMARGIDSLCQREAVRYGGSSYGVIAGGADICYPRENLDLYMELQEKGGIIAEQPPGTPPIAKLFPARNRIISGLCDVLIVIEAKEQSGTLITVDRALEQGRDVYAFPGAVTNELSKGCHNLIRQGAGILLSVDDMVRELGLICDKNMKKQGEIEILLENTEKLVYSCLDLLPKGLDELMTETNVSAKQLIRTLISLEMQGLICEITKNYYVKIK